MFTIASIRVLHQCNLIDLRLEEVFGSQEWFGCKNMLLVGDVLQLQPVNEVNETCSTRKSNKRAVNSSTSLTMTNLTAGLEAKLVLAVGAQIMLRYNIDTNAGLVNGAIGCHWCHSVH